MVGGLVGLGAIFILEGADFGAILDEMEDEVSICGFWMRQGHSTATE